MFLLGWTFDSRADDQKLPELRARATEWHLKASETGHAWYHKAKAAGMIMSANGYEIEGPRQKDDVPQLSCPASP